jgi:8-oxo-dGTP pyrophosphatase MutT (NUDIX family)/SAM-dependent methyltransferase
VPVAIETVARVVGVTTSQWAVRAESFGSVADSYERYRPGYPAEAVEWLVGDQPARVLDLGAGTGKLTRALVVAGHDVTAVEPSEPMLAELRSALPGVDARVGSAEAIPADDASFDVVIVAQAFHWFDKSVAVPEIARVLCPGGRFALVWNLRDESEPWVRAIWSVIAPDEPRVILHAELPNGAPLSPMENATFAHSQRVDRETVLGLALSRSYVASAPPERQAELLNAAGSVFDRLTAGHATLPYVTHCYRTERLARRAARVILVDSESRVMLQKYARHGGDSDVWITPGGGLDPGESPPVAAARELYEEAGLQVDPAELGPMVATSSGRADLGWASGLFRDDFYVYRTDITDVSPTHLSDLEIRLFLEARWWTVDELATTSEVVYPLGLVDLVRSLVAGHRPESPIELPWYD